MNEQDGLCHYCGIEMTMTRQRHNTCTREHVIPRAHGGGNHKENIVGACAVCNNARGDSDYLTFKLMVETYGRPHGDPFGDRYRVTSPERRQKREAEKALTANCPASRKDTLPSAKPDLKTIFSGTLGDKCGKALERLREIQDSQA